MKCFHLTLLFQLQKEFDLRQETDKVCFLNEVKRLKALSHPCVVEVQVKLIEI